MALAGIIDAIPVISVSLGILDIDIDLNPHRSTSRAPSSSVHTPTQTPTSSSRTVPILPTTTPFVTITATPTSQNPGERSTSVGSPAPISSITEHTTFTTPPVAVAPTVITTSVSGAAGFSKGIISESGAGGSVIFPSISSPLSEGLPITLPDGVPIAAAEGIPTVAITFDDKSSIRPLSNYPASSTGLISNDGGASATGVSNGSSPSNPPGRHSSSPLTPGIIAAIAISLALILIGFLIILCCRKTRKRRDQDTILWSLRSYGSNSRSMASALPFHSRSRSAQEKSLILTPTSPTSPTFFVRPVAETSQDTHSLQSAVSRERDRDIRLSASSEGSTSYSSRSEESSQFLRYEEQGNPTSPFSGRPRLSPIKIPEDFEDFPSRISSSPLSPFVQQPPNNIPATAFRLMTSPLPPIPPLPSSPPPMPPSSPRPIKVIPGGLVPPYDHTTSRVKVLDPFRDPTD